MYSGPFRTKPRWPRGRDEPRRSSYLLLLFTIIIIISICIMISIIIIIIIITTLIISSIIIIVIIVTTMYYLFMVIIIIISGSIPIIDLLGWLAEVRLFFVWRLLYNFTNYNFTQHVEFQKATLNFTPLARFMFNNSRAVLKL